MRPSPKRWRPSGSKTCWAGSPTAATDHRINPYEHRCQYNESGAKLPVCLVLLYGQPILLIDQDLTRRSSPRQLLSRCYRLGFRPVHAGGSPGTLSFYLPPLLLGVGPHEVGLHLALGAQRPPLGLQALVASRPSGGFAQSAYGLVQRFFGAASFLPTHRGPLLLLVAVFTLQLFHLALRLIGKSPPRLPPVPQSSYWSFSPGSISSRLSAALWTSL